MDEATALRLIDALGNGVHPLTGETLESDHVCQHPDVIRALALSSRALEDRRVRLQRQRNLPANVGKPWRDEENDRLVNAFRAGKSFEDMAQMLGRSTTGVQARLERLGLLAPSAYRWPISGGSFSDPRTGGNDEQTS